MAAQGEITGQRGLFSLVPLKDAPIVYDVCCGVGGASMGYRRAGFNVIGIDLNAQPDYPFEFHQMDVRHLIGAQLRWGGAAFIHFSPPCQKHSALTKGTNYGRQYTDVLEYCRELGKESGVPYVIENVQGAPLRKDVVLCGEMFGLGVIRHRVFEFGNMPPMPQPEEKPHRGRVAGYRHGQWYDGPYKAVYGDGGGKGTVREWQQAMGIYWTSNRKSIAEAIPPAYTECIGRYVADHLRTTPDTPELGREIAS